MTAKCPVCHRALRDGERIGELVVLRCRRHGNVGYRDRNGTKLYAREVIK